MGVPIKLGKVRVKSPSLFHPAKSSIWQGTRGPHKIRDFVGYKLPSASRENYKEFCDSLQDLSYVSSIRRFWTTLGSIVDVKADVQASLNQGRFGKELSPPAGLTPDCVNRLTWQA